MCGACCRISWSAAFFSAGVLACLKRATSCWRYSELAGCCGCGWTPPGGVCCICGLIWADCWNCCWYGLAVWLLLLRLGDGEEVLVTGEPTLMGVLMRLASIGFWNWEFWFCCGFCWLCQFVACWLVLSLALVVSLNMGFGVPVGVGCGLTWAMLPWVICEMIRGCWMPPGPW